MGLVDEAAREGFEQVLALLGQQRAVRCVTASRPVRSAARALPIRFSARMSMPRWRFCADGGAASTVYGTSRASVVR
ncbi:hypothetical protein ABZ499_11440 [Streptomyces sp. NPDC019990]|uniref:hypothetical protein n=1 Tax=Streptomyces sp. NPDC019990 TaxID=3154693 RepID=UPI0033BFD596